MGLARTSTYWPSSRCYSVWPQRTGRRMAALIWISTCGKAMSRVRPMTTGLLSASPSPLIPSSCFSCCLLCEQLQLGQSLLYNAMYTHCLLLLVAFLAHLSRFSASLSVTYAFDDFLLSRLSALVGDSGSEASATQRAQNYRHSWSAEKEFMCPRSETGAFQCPTTGSSLDSWQDYIEGESVSEYIYPCLRKLTRHNLSIPPPSQEMVSTGHTSWAHRTPRA